MSEPYTLVRELAEAYHQTGNIRDHHDPTDETGWHVKGIETCRDPLCVEALAGPVIDHYPGPGIEFITREENIARTSADARESRTITGLLNVAIASRRVVKKPSKSRLRYLAACLSELDDAAS